MACKRRIKRDYRRSTPSKFRAFCHKVKHCLTDNPHYPDSTWGGSMVLQIFFEKVDRLEVAYHRASNGDRILIRDRDRLMDEIVVLLEEIASLLEAGSIMNPDALLTTGFSVTQERRSANRPKLSLVSPADFTVANSGERGKAVGSATRIQGVYNHEIQLNRVDPAQERDWMHVAVFPTSSEMIMEGLEPGNTFFRMRHHGPKGPGPWSAIMSVTIS